MTYHLSTEDIFLFVPQNYHQMHGSNSSVYYDRVYMHLNRHEVAVKINRKGSNLTVLFDSAMTSDENKDIGLQYRSGLAYSGII